jgi:hypothetical protein
MVITHAPAELIVSSIGNGIDRTVRWTVAARDAVASEGDRLAAENARLHREMERLQQDNCDLRASAEIWIRLYEKQLSRANHATLRLAQCTAALPR